MSWKFTFKKIGRHLNITKISKAKRVVQSVKQHYSRRGYNAAKEELTFRIEHIYTEEPKIEQLPQNHVVPPSKLNFNEDDVREFYKETFQKQPENRRPNQDQLKLIFSSSRNTLAIAGAGSGKTTSLINRLLFLYKNCHIPLEQLTVFSFTRASVDDFRKKLVEVFGANGIKVTKEKSEEVIRTFHSKVLEMSKDSILKGQVKIFEFLRDKVDIDHENNDAEEQYKLALKKANEEVVMVSELCNAQTYYLYHALDAAYNESAEFRSNIDNLFLQKVQLKMKGSDPSMDVNIIRKTNEFEIQLAPLMSNFFELQSTAQEGRNLDLSQSEYSALKLSSDAYYSEQNLHVIFAPNIKLLKEKNINCQLEVRGFKQRVSALVKRKAFIGVNYAKDNVYIVTDQQDVTALEIYLNNYSSEQKDSKRALLCPRFSTKFDGDFKFKPLIDVFFEIATFTESIGVKLEHINLYTDKSTMSYSDKLLLNSLAPFWKTFDRVLADNGIIRFNNLFQTFSEPNNAAFNTLSTKVKHSLTNIIIDEFQDISPEVARWIQATLRTLTQDDLKTSLMCVGDDFQSIYGWRGSSPEFLSKYDHYFPSEEIKNVFMSQNYRSFQSIVDTAESCLKYKTDFKKTGKCNLLDSQPRLYFYQSGATKNKETKTVTTPAKELFADIYTKLIEENEDTKETQLLVMAKTNDVINKLTTSCKNRLKDLSYNQDENFVSIEFQTFHRSKGLEAKYCLLVEDCEYDNQHKAKNYLYKLAGFEKTFDEAQREEAMRLAYVAVTRAKEKVWWIAPEDSEGSFDHARAYAEKHGYGYTQKLN